MVRAPAKTARAAASIRWRRAAPAGGRARRPAAGGQLQEQDQDPLRRDGQAHLGERQAALGEQQHRDRDHQTDGEPAQRQEGEVAAPQLRSRQVAAARAVRGHGSSGAVGKAWRWTVTSRASGRVVASRPVPLDDCVELRLHRGEPLGPEGQPVVGHVAGGQPLGRELAAGLVPGGQRIAVAAQDVADQPGIGLARLGVVDEVGAAPRRRLVHGPPPAVAPADVVGVVLHQAGLGQLPEVVAGLAAVGAGALRQRRGGGGALLAQQAHQAACAADGPGPAAGHGRAAPTSVRRLQQRPRPGRSDDPSTASCPSPYRLHSFFAKVLCKECWCRIKRPSAVALLHERVAAVVVAALLPVAGDIALEHLDARHPLDRLPEVEVRHQRADRSAVLRRDRAAVDGRGDQATRAAAGRRAAGWWSRRTARAGACGWPSASGRRRRAPWRWARPARPCRSGSTW